MSLTVFLAQGVAVRLGVRGGDVPAVEPHGAGAGGRRRRTQLLLRALPLCVHRWVPSVERYTIVQVPTL